jgi:hypothetical protein
MPYTDVNGWFYPNGEDVPFEAVDYDKTILDLEAYMGLSSLETGDGIFATSDWNGSAVASTNAIDISTGQAIIEGAIHRTTTVYRITSAEGLTLSATNYIWRKPDGTFAANTTGTAPVANSLLLFSAVMDSDDAASINNAPNGRKQLSAGSRFGNRILLVSPGGQYSTLSSALTAITTATATDQWLVIVSGWIAETAVFNAKSNVSVLFLPGSRLTITSTANSHGITFTSVVNSVWQGYGLTPCIYRAGVITTTAYTLFTSSVDSTLRFINLGVENTVTGTTGNSYGISMDTASNLEINNCYFKGSDTGTNSYGGRIRSSNPTIRNTRFVGGNGGSASYGCRVTTTSSVAANPVFYDCEFLGGNGGSSCAGMFADTGANVQAFRCRFFGGEFAGVSCHGVSFSSSYAHLESCIFRGGNLNASCYGIDVQLRSIVTLVNCSSRGGEGGTSCYGIRLTTNCLVNAFKSTFMGGGVGVIKSGTYTFSSVTSARFQLSTTMPGKIIGATIVISVATVGATVQLADASSGGNNISGTASLAATGTLYIPINANVLIPASSYVYTNVAGGTAPDNSFVVTYSFEPSFGGSTVNGSCAVYNDSDSKNKFISCDCISNIDSDAGYFSANGISQTSIFGGVWSSGPRSVGTRKKAINAASAWASAPVYGVILDGGQTNLTCVAGVANQTSWEV